MSGEDKKDSPTKEQTDTPMKDEATQQIDTSSSQTQKKNERGVKINIGENKPEEFKEADEDYTDNPYLYDTSGPRRKIDYG